MTNYNPEAEAAVELHRKLAAVLQGHDQPLVGTALVIAVADWLRQFNRPDLDELQRDQIRIAILMRFLKGVAQELSLDLEVDPLDLHDDEIRFDA